MKRKLNSERGVALAFVIAAFAVVMVLGTVGITAGYANLSKAFDRKDGKQAYYTLISAARLLREELDGAELVVTEQWLIPEEAGDWVPMGEPEVTLPDSALAAQLLMQLANGAAEVSATVRIERAGYSQDIAWNICLADAYDDTRIEGESTRNAEMTLSCGGRTVSVEAHLTRIIKQEIVADNVTKDTTTYTLTIGAIHEEAS